MNPEELKRKNLRPRVKSMGPKYVRTSVSTLDPLKLRPSDFIDFSGLQQPSVNVDPICQLSFYKGVPFPANTRGFIYYHPPPPGINLLAGEVRFRLVENGDPECFERGSDLMSPTGLPWFIHFLALNNNKSYKGLRNIALRDELITPPLLEKCDSIEIRTARAPVIHSLGQPFPVSFDRRLTVRILADNAKLVMITSTFLDRRSDLVRFPYTGDARPLTNMSPCTHPNVGRGIMCFERSPFDYHEGRRTLVLRILKITEPVRCVIPKYDGHTPKPIEGELVRITTFGFTERPWWCDVDETCKSMESLKYLVDFPSKAY